MTAPATAPTDLLPVPIPGTDQPVHAVRDEDGKAWVLPRRVCETLGLDWRTQHRKLTDPDNAWSCVVEMTTQLPGDTQSRKVTVLDLDSFPMWLATIKVNKVREDIRPVLIAYQREAARALRDYFFTGSAINPNADAAQRDAAREKIDALEMERARAELDALNAHAVLTEAQAGTARAQTLAAIAEFLPEDYVETRARMIVGEATSSPTEIADADRTLYAKDYLLHSTPMPTADVARHASVFGRRVREEYESRHGHRPPQDEVPGKGRVTKIFAYTEKDRPVMDFVWTKFYAEKYPTP